jgi:hypothetical protein
MFTGGEDSRGENLLWRWLMFQALGARPGEAKLVVQALKITRARGNRERLDEIGKVSW